MSLESKPILDFYRIEYQQFQADVHILIEGTLYAGIRYLDNEAKDELGKLEEWMKRPISDEAHEHLVDKQIEVWARNTDQERFLRNMALVALAAQLTHSLRKMARSAETFSPRKKQYGESNQSEFDRVWLEYTERFKIDFDVNEERIAFVEPMRIARNQIAHEGGEANTLKPKDIAALSDGRLLKRYREYVEGGEVNGAVSVSEELLERNITASVELVGWLAGELYSRELAWFQRSQ